MGSSATAAPGRSGAAVAALAAVLVVVLALAGCTVRLAPEHEPTIVQGLQDLAAQTETFLESVKDGAAQGSYQSERRNGYDALVGRARAIALLVEARPEPKPAFLRWLGYGAADAIEPSGDQGGALWEQVHTLDVPTDDQLAWYVEELGRMRADDAAGGLQAGQVRAYRIPLLRALKNAVTYEMALNR